MGKPNGNQAIVGVHVLVLGNAHERGGWFVLHILRGGASFFAGKTWGQGCWENMGARSPISKIVPKDLHAVGAGMLAKADQVQKIGCPVFSRQACLFTRKARALCAKFA